MTWRGVGALEWRRTGGAFVAVALALTGVVLFAAKQRPFNTWSTWSSTVADALEFVSSSGIVLGPVVATVAAWVAGRERRRRMGDLLASTARPSWQRRLATSGAVSAALLLGWLIQTAVVVGGVFPSVSYWGGRWWATLLLMALGMLLCAAVGSAFGRWVPGRLVPPALGIVLYVLTAIPVYLDARWIQLVPVGNLAVFDGEQLEARVIPLAAAWTGSLVVMIGVVALGRRRHWRVAAAAAGVAVVCAAALQVAPHLGRDGAPGVEPVQRSWVEADPAAVVPVCTDDAPVVCVQRIHAGFLRDVAPVARQQLQVVGRYLPVDRAEELDWGVTGAADVFPLIPLSGMGQPYRSGADPDALQQWAGSNLSSLTAFYCPEMEHTSPAWAVTVSDTADLLLGQQAFAQDERGAALAARLEADPAQARAWMASFLTASRSCDVPELERLAAW
ncbi:hypothetical protein SAMN06264364_12120 [Quadrisphaera granulorum]|uniref:ABC-type transport system involved in multi-copper enzyme maturation permease subunit n=1 Tax=Quadrisphaera granulorum TaxID=317664 RepID=A0A316A0M5_9ACTN|nr:hypothetical protein [Quadrisphaera granulorum]PWJ51143.1 hypothetical protein BXY45_12120 [Quadrisphaera granulorum]SZE97793.1 hypothetical protein SAMN06264364_12120 [Quadrisphaera granulorum]